MQLTVLGYILVPIFTYNMWWLVLLYSFFMLYVGCLEAVQRPAYTYQVTSSCSDALCRQQIAPGSCRGGCSMHADGPCGVPAQERTARDALPVRCAGDAAADAGVHRERLCRLPVLQPAAGGPHAAMVAAPGAICTHITTAVNRTADTHLPGLWYSETYHKVLDNAC